MDKAEKERQIRRLVKRIGLVQELLPVLFTGDLSQLRPLTHITMLRHKLYKLQATKTNG
jgi:hypothetical protein